METPNFLKELYNEEQIKIIIRHLGKQITRSYSKQDKLKVLCLAEGGLMFCMDLIRQIDLPIEYHTCIIKSYGNEHKSKKPKIIYFPNIMFENNDKYLIVDDICDSGNSIKCIINYLIKQNIQRQNIKICTLLKNGTKQSEIQSDFNGITTNGEWLVGYGFDQKQLYRNIPNLMYIKQ